MKNFKEIAEKCLSGELSGTFKLASGKFVSSDNLKRAFRAHRNSTYQYQMYVNGVPFSYSIYGTLFSFQPDSLDIIDFIPDNIMQEQIKIDIPEGKVPVMEQTENGVVITWKEKELTYNQIYESLWKNGKVIHFIENPGENTVQNLFIRKVNAYRKLTNIRNYFGKPDENEQGWTIEQEGIRRTLFESKYTTNRSIVFTKKEHAEQAIKMLGDELKYLFEPW